MELYFLALLPPKDLNEKIWQLKQEFALKYGAKRALRLPAHITLQIPFKMEEEKEPEILKSLRDFSATQEPVPIELSGFGQFSRRTVFIGVEPNLELQELFSRLQQLILSQLDLKDHEKVASFHPHISIATRDLHKKNFVQAWEDFKDRPFKDFFTAKSLTLFKHNHQTWDILEDFPFKN